MPLLAHDESRRGWFSQQSHPLQTAASLLVSLRGSVSLTVARVQRLYLWSPLRTVVFSWEWKTGMLIDILMFADIQKGHRVAPHIIP